MSKPILLFFQYKYDQRLPPFLLIHKQEHVKCLEEFFKVIVVREDCDFSALCDKYQPDLALFESGVSHLTCKRLRIINVRSNPGVPKIALHHADAFCNAREGFISDIEHWGISTVFAISTTAGEHTPEMTSDLFYWPVFVDADIIRDYGNWKSIPVLATGNSSQFYPWRQAVFPIISAHYPTLVCPHPGYDPKPGFNQILVGERYARTLNAAWCVPACGTVAKEAVRKHFEVPGSRSCLVTERSPSLESAGFVDMKNCVFADATDVVDKLDSLFSNQETLNNIIDAGYELVQSSHTHKQRNQIFEWYCQNLIKNDNTKIIQLNPFQAPISVEIDSRLKTNHISPSGAHLRLIKTGDTHFANGSFEAAEKAYRMATNYMLWMPEPKLRAGLCNLRLGQADEAQKLIYTNIDFTLSKYGAADPDPVEWAYYVVCLLCKGDLKRAVSESARFPDLRHVELRRVRSACARLSGAEFDVPSDSDVSRRSIHVFPPSSAAVWDAALVSMLEACGQTRLASAYIAAVRGLGDSPNQRGPAPRRSTYVGAGSAIGRARGMAQVGRVSFWIRSRIAKAKHEVGNQLRRLERKFGCFLPFEISAVREDELIKRLCRDFSEDAVSGSLVIGADVKRPPTRAAMFGSLQGKGSTKLYCVGIDSTSDCTGAEPAQRETGAPNSQVINVAGGTSLASVAQTVSALRDAHGIVGFDRVLIDCHVMQDKLGSQPVDISALGRAEIVYVYGTSTVFGARLQSQLLESADYQSVVIEPVRGSGHSIFRRTFRPRPTAATSPGGVFAKQAAYAPGNP